MNYHNMPVRSYEETFRDPELIQEGGDSFSQAVIRDPDCVGVLEKKAIDPLAEGGRLVLGGMSLTGGSLFAISGENAGYVIIALGVYFAGSGVWRLRKYFRIGDSLKGQEPLF